MHQSIVTLGVLGGVFLLGAARADRPPEVATASKTTPNTQLIASESLAPGDYVGRIVSVNATGNALVLQMTTQRQVLKNPDGPTRTFDQIVQEEEQKVGRAVQDAVISRSPADYERKRQEAARAVAQFQKALPKQLNQLQQQLDNPQPVEYVTLSERKEVPLPTAKGVKVRLRDLPTIDADGLVRKYTADDIKQLKGKEPNQPGFDGKLSDLKPGEYVRVTLAPKAAVEPKVIADTAVAKPVAEALEITAIVVIGKDQAEKAGPARP